MSDETIAQSDTFIKELIKKHSEVDFKSLYLTDKSQVSLIGLFQYTRVGEFYANSHLVHHHLRKLDNLQ